MVEKFFGNNSLEASNCYFLVGIYYFEEKFHQKALACFMKSLNIREKRLGERHQSCSDCRLNMGILYKKLGALSQAASEMEKAIAMRRETVGYSSIPVAKGLEHLGKLYLEQEKY